MMSGDVFEVRINLSGCDDETHFRMSVDEDGYRLLKRIEVQSKETSTYGCMPQFFVEKL